MLSSKRGVPGFRWIFMSLDAALTAHIRPREAVIDLFHAVFRPRSSNYNRISSLLNLFDRLHPGIAEKTARDLLQSNRLPLVGYQVSLLAYGSGSTVFLLKNGQDQKVLKVFRRSLGQPARRVWEVASEYQEKHRAICSWFNNPYQIVIPSQFMVLHGPLLGVASAALLQPYVSGKKHDLFLDFSVEEIIQLGKKDRQLRLQLLDFSERLFKSMQETDRCFDLVGRENLMLVEGFGKMKLTIADNGVFDLQFIRNNNPALFARLESHLQHLRQIQEGLQRG